MASTTSSYIPTAGATVTRAAETLTVAAANLPYSAVAMSIQMDGEMTYADEGVVTAANLMRWDAGDDIYLRMKTNGSYTGGVEYRVYNSGGGGTSYATESTPGSYAPGVNVSFNIAARTVSSSAIKVAVDGSITGTAATPPAMPDLSATNMQLGYTYMGTIGKFRMWDEDLGDTGIAEAST